MNINIKIQRTPEYEKEIKKSKKKHRPVEVMLICFLAIAHFNIIGKYAMHIRKTFKNPNGKKCKKLIKAIAHEAKHLNDTLTEIDEHQTHKDSKYPTCREFHPYRVGNWGSSLDKLVVLYQITAYSLDSDQASITIKAVRTGNHDF